MYLPDTVVFNHLKELVANKLTGKMKEKYPEYEYYASIKNSNKIYPFNIPKEVKNYNFIQSFSDSLNINIAFSNLKDNYEVWLYMIKISKSQGHKIICMFGKCHNEKEQKLIIEMFKTVKIKPFSRFSDYFH
jgi:hypothetical protein